MSTYPSALEALVDDMAATAAALDARLDRLAAAHADDYCPVAEEATAVTQAAAGVLGAAHREA